MPRRCGKTTGGLLEALGYAVKNPGEEVLYVDEISNSLTHSYQLVNLDKMITQLDLKDIETWAENDGIHIKSNFKVRYEGSDGYMYTRERMC